MDAQSPPWDDVVHVPRSRPVSVSDSRAVRASVAPEPLPVSVGAPPASDVAWPESARRPPAWEQQRPPPIPPLPAAAPLPAPWPESLAALESSELLQLLGQASHMLLHPPELLVRVRQRQVEAER